MNQKLLTATVGIATLFVGSLAFASMHGNMGDMRDFASIKTAIESNNYASLDADQKSDITPEKFAKMVERYTEHKAIEEAIAAGDYTAFRAAWEKKIPTQEEFISIVADKKARDAQKIAIEAAVKANDFAAFKLAVNSVTPKGHDGDDGEKMTPPTDKQLKKQLKMLVKYYVKNGKMPEMAIGMKGMGEMKGMKEGRNEGMKGMGEMKGMKN